MKKIFIVSLVKKQATGIGNNATNETTTSETSCSYTGNETGNDATSEATTNETSCSYTGNETDQKKPIAIKLA